MKRIQACTRAHTHAHFNQCYVLAKMPYGGENLTHITFPCQRQNVMDLSNHSKSSKIFCHHHITTDRCSERLKAVAPGGLQVKLDHCELKHRHFELTVISPTWHFCVCSRITSGQREIKYTRSLPTQFRQCSLERKR